ncbi:MAG: hypothetical protein GY869_26775 [Planctomycetes bacterium]|nr:hypothetical protein [Planctomycetota bacterium]
MDVDGIRFTRGDIIELQSASNRLAHGGIVQSISGTTVYLGQTINLASSIYSGNDPVLHFRSNDDDVAGELTVTGPWDTDTEYVTVSSIGALAAGDPFGIGRDDDDFDLVEVEEVHIDDNQKCHIVAINYPGDDAYRHSDYTSGTINI